MHVFKFLSGNLSIAACVYKNKVLVPKGGNEKADSPKLLRLHNATY